MVWCVCNWIHKKILSPNLHPHLVHSLQAGSLSHSFGRMPKTHWCYCNRCHGKLIWKSTFYNHNPRGTGGVYHTGSPPQAWGTADTAPKNVPVQGGPPLNIPASDQSIDVMSEADMDHLDADHRPDSVCANPILSVCQLTRLYIGRHTRS